MASGTAQRIPVMQCGITDDITLEPDSATQVSVTFPVPFSRAPQVVLQLQRGYGTASVMTKIATNVMATSTTGADIRVYNGNTDAIGLIKLRWIAME